MIEFVKDRPGHDRRYAIDATKIKKKLSWTPRYKFEDAIELTIDWYLNNMDWVNSVRSGEYMKWIERNYGESLVRQVVKLRHSSRHRRLVESADLADKIIPIMLTIRTINSSINSHVIFWRE